MSQSDNSGKFELIAVLFLYGSMVGVILTTIAAYITHLIWTIKLLGGTTAVVTHIVLGVLGLLFPPIGVVHGIMLWFGIF